MRLRRTPARWAWFVLASTLACGGEHFRSGDDRAPLAVPPGGLAARSVPQFVAIGWDDNGIPEGVAWSLELLGTRTNPLGRGQPETHDGAPLTATYFHTTAYARAAAEVWRQAAAAGHEVANHTHSHAASLEGSEDFEIWLSEMRECQERLTNDVGLPGARIVGFRAPFLGTSDAMLRAVVAMGFLYDASLEEGFQRDQDGRDFFWPYTLDRGSPGNEFFAETQDKRPILPHRGLWELPVHALIVPPDDAARRYGIQEGLRKRLAALHDYFEVHQGKITGFDYNLWVEFELSVEEVTATLKYTLDQRLAGNRAPLLFGAHTHLYAGGSAFRRAAIEAFLDYALSKPDVRVVGFRQVLEWTREPVPLF